MISLTQLTLLLCGLYNHFDCINCMCYQCWSKSLDARNYICITVLAKYRSGAVKFASSAEVHSVIVMVNHVKDKQLYSKVLILNHIF